MFAVRSFTAFGHRMYSGFLHLAIHVSDPLAVAGVLLFGGFVLTHLAFHGASVRRFVCQLVTFAGFTLMLSLAAVEPFRPTPAMDMTPTFIVVSFFKICWWLAAAWLIAGLLRAVLVFKRQPVETRFLQDIFSGLCYMGASLGIIAYVFDTPVRGLLAASGVIAIVLGLALQSTLGDLFSGVVLNLAKPYRPGDWVILDAALEGRVVETNWRATQLLTLANNIAFVPNSVIAKARLVNASRPSEIHGIKLTVRLDATGLPSASVSVLEAALLSCNHILHHPVPIVTIQMLDAVALDCDLTFFVNRIEAGPAAQNEVFDRIYRFCASAGVRLAPPAASGLALPVRSVMDPGAVPRRILDKLAIFALLSEDQRMQLAPKMSRRVFRTGETLLEQGVVPSCLSVLYSGVIAAVQLHGGKAVEIFRVAPGDCFAQAGVLTGAASLFKIRALTTSVVYEIGREDFAAILSETPAIAAELVQITARREAEGQHRLAAIDAALLTSESLSGRLADRIKLAFGLS
jgi:small-conductance mechanosensitive channel/CRP-like cAMP-binding protein